jgi:p-aminobenzoyl-glutamate transporter AbgT
MIIILIVLIIVGVAYGMYLKMIKHRKDKKVSLLTEGEEVD